MAKKYTYPRVTVNHTAKQHSNVQPAPADTTVMFLPIVTKKGPHKEIVPVHSLSEFISIFGNLDYETNGQMALNAYNWLRNGGTIYVYRLAGYGEASDNTLQIKAKLYESGTSVWKKEATVPANTKIIRSVSLSDLYETIPADNFKYYLNSKAGMIFEKTNATGAEGYNTYVKAPDDYDYSKTYNKNLYVIADGYDDSGTVKMAISTTLPTNIVYKECLFLIPTGKTGTADEVKAIEYFEKNTTSTTEKTYGSAKYFGEYYNNLEVHIDCLQNEVKNIENEIVKNQIFTITVYENSKNSKLKIESFPRRTKSNYKNAILSSEYIDSDFDIDSILSNLAAGSSKILYMKNANDKSFKTDLATLPTFWASTEPSVVLGNASETPVDIIFDAGYPLSIKQSMMKFINNANGEAIRPDIVGIFDECELGRKVDTTDSSKIEFGYLNIPETVAFSGVEDVATNIALYGQYFSISDEIFTSQNIYVTPSYFLSKLIAYNDMTYGIQYPTAGIRRGILDDAEAIFSNPNADTKQAYFEAKINYAEKTPREYAFMSQRTHDNSSEESYTALSFLNNIRVLEKMKKELERLGRNYLFEFNDSVTLSQLSNVLNKYVAGWIANRTLATGVVTVAKNPWSDEAVDITLTIKFNGTIEVITVDITIE